MRDPGSLYDLSIDGTSVPRGLHLVAGLTGFSDAGAAVTGLTTDQRGIARPQGSAPDIGAFESRSFVLTIVSGGNQVTIVGQSFGQPLVVSVSSPFGERFTWPSEVRGALATKNSGWLRMNAACSGPIESYSFPIGNLNGSQVV